MTSHHRTDVLLPLAYLGLQLCIRNNRFLPPMMRTASFYRGRATGEQVSDPYNKSRIVVNVHHPQSKQGLNMRTIEAAGLQALNWLLIGKV